MRPVLDGINVGVAIVVSPVDLGAGTGSLWVVLEVQEGLLHWLVGQESLVLGLGPVGHGVVAESEEIGRAHV